MTRRVRETTILLASAVATLIPTGPACAATFGAERLRDSAVRGLAGLQSSQAVSDSQRTCTSCHHHLQPPIAFRVAREHGIPVDEKAALAEVRHAFNFSDIIWNGLSCRRTLCVPLHSSPARRSTESPPNRAKRDDCWGWASRFLRARA
jgi:hypothetical protein